MGRGRVGSRPFLLPLFTLMRGRLEFSELRAEGVLESSIHGQDLTKKTWPSGFSPALTATPWL